MEEWGPDTFMELLLNMALGLPIPSTTNDLDGGQILSGPRILRWSLRGNIEQANAWHSVERRGLIAVYTRNLVLHTQFSCE